MKKLLVFFVAMITAFTFAGAQEMQMLPNDPAVKTGKLDNGMTYYIRHNEKPADRAEFYLATHVGALQEAPDQDGLAHFLEHMCFNGTKNFPGKGILNYLESIGASFGGNVNASTGVEQTIYLLTNIPLVNDQVVDNCLLIMHDYSHFVTCDPAEIDAERGVILEEKRTRNDANWRMREQLYQYLFKDTKYATTSIIGSEENLKTFKPESLVNFYQTWYQPNNQALIVVGDIDVDEVEAKIKKIFADIPAPVDPKAKDVIMIPGNSDPVIGIVTDPECPSVSMEVFWNSDATPAIINSTAQGLMVDLLKDIISTVMAERFNDIAAQPDSPFLNAGMSFANLCETMESAYASVAAAPDKILPAFAAMMVEIEKMKRFGFTDAEVERAKTEILSQYESAARKADTRTNSEFVMPLINHFFQQKAYMDPQQRFEIVSMIMPQLQAQVINMVAAQLITDENMVVLYEGPKKEGIYNPSEEEIKAVLDAVKGMEIQANEAEEVDSEFLNPASLKGSKIKKSAAGAYGSTIWTLKNGVKVVLLPTEHEKDRISFNLRLAGGTSLISDADVKSFEDNILTLFLQNSGISQFSNTQVQKMLSGKQLTVSPYISQLNHGVNGSSTVKDIETAFQMMYLQFVDPRFDENEYAQGIKTIEAVLPGLMSQPNYKLQEELISTIYDSPRKAFISDEVLKAASLDAIERNYRMLFKDAAGAVLYVVGDFEIDEMRPLVEKYIGSLPKGKKALNWKDTGESIASKTVKNEFRSTMETPKVTVVEVYKAETPYSYDLEVNMDALSYILNMLYVETLRESEGGTYGAQVASDVSRRPQQYAILQVAFETNEAQADQLQKIALDGLKQIAAEGPSQDYFEKTVNNLKKNIPESRIRNSYWLGRLITNQEYSEDGDKAYEAAVDALTPDSIKKMAKALVDGYLIEVVQRPAQK